MIGIIHLLLFPVFFHRVRCDFTIFGLDLSAISRNFSVVRFTSTRTSSCGLHITALSPKARNSLLMPSIVSSSPSFLFSSFFTSAWRRSFMAFCACRARARFCYTYVVIGYPNCMRRGSACTSSCEASVEAFRGRPRLFGAFMVVSCFTTSTSPSPCWRLVLSLMCSLTFCEA